MTDKQLERRQEILQAVLPAFLEKGYDKTSMDDVVKISGVSKGTLYWHFKNKEALFAALIELVMRDFLLNFQQVSDYAAKHSATDTLRLMCTSWIDLMEQQPDYLKMFVDFFLQAAHHPQVKTVIATFYQEYMQLMIGIIERGIANGEFRPVNAAAVASILAGALDGLGLQLILREAWHLDAMPDIRAILETLAETVIRGLQNEEPHD